jgi:Na+/glutamate symporter
MSGDGFHVHGPHDHEIEHAVHSSFGDSEQQGQKGHGGHDGGGKLVSQIAMATAIIATVGAIFSYMGGATQANAGLYKNNAAIKKTEASNQWNYFQAKSTKQSLIEMTRELAPEDRKASFQPRIDRYDSEKKVIQKEAEKLEADSKRWDEESEVQMHQHHRWAQATTVLQVSIALAAIALLTRKKWLEYAMFGVAGVGLIVGALAAMHI